MNKKTAKQNEKETMVEFRSMSSRLQIFSSSCILISFHKSIWSQLSTYIKHIYTIYMRMLVYRKDNGRQTKFKERTKRKMEINKYWLLVYQSYNWVFVMPSTSVSSIQPQSKRMREKKLLSVYSIIVTLAVQLKVFSFIAALLGVLFTPSAPTKERERKRARAPAN